MFVQQDDPPHRKFVVIWQNVKDSANEDRKQIARIRAIISDYEGDLNGSTQP